MDRKNTTTIQMATNNELLSLLNDSGPQGKVTIGRIRLQTDLPLFASHCFPSLCRLAPSRLHHYLFQRRRGKTLLPIPQRRGEMDVVLAPRGAAKSTLMSLVFPLHAMLYRTEGYIILISATMRQATQRLANIRGALLQNPMLRRLYPRELETMTRPTSRALELCGVRMEAYSAGTEIRGISHGPWRPTWIILDDAERSERTRVAEHREALAGWFSEVVENLGDAYTNIDVVGTLLHRDALPARLQKRPDATGRTFPSILREAARPELWQAWRERFHNLEDPARVRSARTFYKARQGEMLEGAEVLWPEKESYYDLQVMRETRGRAAFDKEKQNAPWADGSAIFAALRWRTFTLEEGRIIREPVLVSPYGSPTAPWNANVNERDVTPELDLADLRLFGFLDPALGGAGGDFAAIATVGIDSTGYLYLLDVWLERAAPSEQVTRVFDLHERWHYQGFGVETNAFQKLLLEPLEAERARRRTQGRPWDVPFIDQRHRGDKETRILSLEPLLRNGWLLLNAALGEEFLGQLRDFPGGHHDDGPDAAAAAVQMARGGVALSARAESLPRRSRGAVRNF